MSNLHYFRPASIEEAISYLDRGVPAGGCTALIHNRDEVLGIIDLQALDMNYVVEKNGDIFIGAGTKLQRIVENKDLIPGTLINAAIQEAPLNMRNMKSAAGTMLSGDGRSPFATAMLSLNASLYLKPANQWYALQEIFDGWGDAILGEIVTEIKISNPLATWFRSVGRTPRDLPILCLALAINNSVNEGNLTLTLGLGGWGKKPSSFMIEASRKDGIDAIETLASKAEELCSGANDVWGSGEYRADVAGKLIRLQGTEVLRHAN